MTQKITVPDEAVEFILFQRTHLIRFHHNLLYRIMDRISPFSIYERAVRMEARSKRDEIKQAYASDIRSEFETIREFLPDACKSILDIGCGIAGIDVFLYHHYRRSVDHFYLLDKTRTEDTVFYGFKQQGAFYNSLEIAKKVLHLNDIAEDHIELLEATENNEINVHGKVDLILSLISWGFHYPVSVYLTRAHEILSDDGRLVLDVRKGTDGIKLLAEKFGRCDIIHEEKSFLRMLCSK